MEHSLELFLSVIDVIFLFITMKYYHDTMLLLTMTIQFPFTFHIMFGLLIAINYRDTGQLLMFASYRKISVEGSEI